MSTKKKGCPEIGEKICFSVLYRSRKAPRKLRGGGKIELREPRESVIWESSTRIFFALRNKIICLTFNNANDTSSEKSRWVVYHAVAQLIFSKIPRMDLNIFPRHIGKSINLGLPHKKPFSLFSIGKKWDANAKIKNISRINIEIEQ